VNAVVAVVSGELCVSSSTSWSDYSLPSGFVNRHMSAVQFMVSGYQRSTQLVVPPARGPSEQIRKTWNLNCQKWFMVMT